MKRENLRFAKPLVWVIFIATAILSAGCYMTELNADGSGTFTREVFIPPNTDPPSFCRKISRRAPRF